MGEMFATAADGSGQPERLTTSEVLQVPSSWSRDGPLVFIELRPSFDVGALSMEGDGAVRYPLESEFAETYAEVSPDGRWLAYQTTESGENEIYVRSFPNVDDIRRQVSRDGGVNPVWAPDGRELFYRSDDTASSMMVVAVDTEPTLSLGNPTALFTAREFLVATGPRAFDVFPDGQRFLMVKEGATTEGSTAAEIIVVQNWSDELTRLVPTP